MSYYRDQFKRLGKSPRFKVSSATGETNWMHLNIESVHALTEYCDTNGWLSRYDTGAPNAECNDFILTALNNETCYHHILAGHKASYLYKHNAYLSGLDLNKLDFNWLNNAIERARDE